MKRFFKYLLPTVGLIAVVLVVWINRYSIYDYWRLFDYLPPPAVVNLANEDTMTPYARNLFYVYHPQIESSAEFNQTCKVPDQTIVLGCTIIGRGIYLYNVTDTTLNGVNQATAAYEMLHVGYSRLSSSERSYIDGLVLSTYNQAAANNPIIKAEVASYYATEGAAAVPNELHSVVGTEIANLPPALNIYYAQYFSDRMAVVDYTNQYEGVFSQRQQTVAVDDEQLTSWKEEITSDESTLNSDINQINQESNNLKAEKNSGDIATYNAGVAPYNNLVDTYNSLLSATNSLISQYNELVSSRNSVAVSEDQLIQSLSSNANILPNK